MPCASENCLSAQTGFCPSLEIKAAGGSGAGWCWPRHVFLWMGERHVAAQPDLLVAGAHSIHGRQRGTGNLVGRPQNVPALHLCRSCCQATRACSSACSTGRKAPALSPPGTANVGCLLQPFCPEKLNISFSEYRITFLRVCIWTFY